MEGKMKVNMHDYFSYDNFCYNTRGHCFELFVTYGVN